MRFGSLALQLLPAASVVLAAPTPDTTPDTIQTAVDDIASLADQAFKQAETEAADNEINKRGGENTCSWRNVSVRREWGSLSKTQRKAYTDAVLCLQEKPARTPAEVAPGAKTRFDDYVATHINQTLQIHYTGNFLVWHRYYTWLYERALRDECGYTGYQPYWDWAKSAIIGMHDSPIFDGSDSSMSGDGEFIPDREDIILGQAQGLPPVYLPVGEGGGCVKSGPFKDMVVNLGPAALDLPGGLVDANPEGPLAHNPRCLKRDLSTEVNRRYANATAVLANLIQPTNVYDFQMQMQGVPGSGSIGIHGGPHYSLGGDPGRDVFTSPGDPAFYLHHANIDRIWWIWQMLDPQTRIHSSVAIAGTNTFLNQPPSADTTLEDYVEYGYADGPARQIKDLMSTLGGPFCYIYL
ncbi:uncharacterized protein J7T54_008330 [Emericellopsis cladophorae]|uniref:Tyrosinase copper-binding domain-containing protein n=1 Tax=Emericellopsis cladophorae TaxID=2686198 RepID=A0A9P9Y2C9_9HYPO|nr:uncharacterized protein J7T54_008330 [Emericellopsis cladophorae]KAI6782244.1 hypothetical protein J7T54_008330 [Emericellopsis cladophorae]